MKNTTSDHEPRLDPPGAGLPFSQMLAIRLWFGPVVSKRASRPENRARYEHFTRKLLELLASTTVEERTVRVLVKPLPGLEDSSRYWSLNGVMEHLMIVGQGMEKVILSLASGQIPNGKADTATVKPQQAGQDWLAPFTQFAPGFLARVDGLLAQPGMNPDSKLRFAHPWFGPMTANQWYWLLAQHQGIHLRQARNIVSGLHAAGSNQTRLN